MTTSLLGAADRVRQDRRRVGGVGFSIFQIGSDGSYNTVQKG